MSGVPPSPRVTTVEASVTPRRSANSRRTPRQTCAMSVAFHAQDRCDAFDDVARRETFDRLGELLLPCLVGADDHARLAGLVGADVGPLVDDLLLSDDLLLYGRDGHATVGEDACDGREHAGAVVDLEGDLVARDGLAHRCDRQVGAGRLAHAHASRDVPAG